MAIYSSDTNNITSFSSLLSYISKSYSADIAFRSANRMVTYEQFVEAVLKCTSVLRVSAKHFFYVSATDVFLFACGFFSVILAEHIVVLENNVFTSADDIQILEEQDILSMISSGKPEVPPEAEPNRCCLIAFSSGTTGFRKGIMLSQMNLLEDMKAISQRNEFRQGDRYVHVLPWTHLFGIMGDLLLTLFTGGTLYGFDHLSNWMTAIRNYSPNILYLPPAGVEALYSLQQNTHDIDFSTGGHLRKIIVGGAPLNANFNLFFKSYGIWICQAYGLSECAPCISINSEDEHRDGSVGKVLPCCEVQIIDDEVVVRGSNVMLGYYKGQDATKKVIHDGWLYTGDLGFFDKDGFLYLKGRKTNMIPLTNGIKILPEEIEKHLSDVVGIQELLVQGTEDGRCIKIIVRCDFPKEFDYIHAEVKRIIDENYGTQVPCIIQQVLEPLPRNQLGKVIRKPIQ